MRLIATWTLGLCAMLATASHAQTPTYPDRPIRMVVAWPAGGGTDSVARIVAKYLGDKLGQQVIVENRGGASGLVGTEYVARAAPDGYTIQYTVADSHSVNPHVFANVKFDALKDFTPVSLVGSMPNSLIVNPKLPAKDVADFIKLAKSEPGKLTFSSWGVASGGHIRMEAFESLEKIKLLHVPYQGSGPALAAVMAGDVDAMMAPYGLAEAGVKAGKLRALSIDTAQRLDTAPEVATFAEQGIPINLTFWQGILVPAKAPPYVAERIRKAMNEILADPKARADLTRVGVSVGIPGTDTLSSTRSYFDAEYARWGKVIQDAGIKAE